MISSFDHDECDWSSSKFEERFNDNWRTDHSKVLGTPVTSDELMEPSYAWRDDLHKTRGGPSHIAQASR